MSVWEIVGQQQINNRVLWPLKVTEGCVYQSLMDYKYLPNISLEVCVDYLTQIIVCFLTRSKHKCCNVFYQTK